MAKLSTLKSKLYFLREVKKEVEITLLYCRTNDQIVDVLTKALSKASFEELRSKLWCLLLLRQRVVLKECHRPVEDQETFLLKIKIFW